MARSELFWRCPLVSALTLISISILLASVYCRAQVISPATAQQQPIAGAGHDYIGIGTETVSPVDGSVTFNLPIQTPSGRGPSFPFAIHFNSSQPFFLTNNSNGQYFYWRTPVANDMPTSFDLSGWSYALPYYQAQAYISGSSPVSGGCGNPDGNPCPGGNTNYCFSTENYTFQSLDGPLLGLSIQNSWPWNDNPTPTGVCTQTSYPSGGSGFDGIIANFGTPPAGTVGVQPPLTVTDKSGTVYSFASGPAIATSPTAGNAITPFGALAQTITDRNGNQIVLTGTSVYSSGSILGAGSYKDTAGRKAVSWSGLGATAGDDITISGLASSIVVKWTTTTTTLPENLDTVYGSSCSFETPEVGLSMQVVSEIDLPNNTKYLFHYGGAYGLLDQITFPNGGYVRYVWGTSPSSIVTSQTWNNGGSNVGNCSAIIDGAAITDRYVSFDGSTEVLHQSFSYAAPSYSVSENLPIWTAKHTTVTTQQLQGSQLVTTAITKYTYANYDSNNVPLETSVVYQDGSGNNLQSVSKSWLDPYTMTAQQSILNGVVTQATTTLRCPDQYDNIVAVYEYNFSTVGPAASAPACTGLTASLTSGLNTAAIGSLVRETQTTFHNFYSNGTYIVDEPDSKTVLDGSGNQLSQTTYIYDNGAVAPSEAATGLVTPPGTRGNATSVSQWLNTASSALTTKYSYFDTGQIQSMSDPCATTSCPDMTGSSHTTTYSYQDHWNSGSSPGQTSDYLTNILDPVGHTQSYTYNYASGQMASSTDSNLRMTSYDYTDPMLRLTDIYEPASPQNSNAQPHTHYSYVDDSLYSSLTTTDPIGITSLATTDGMGHVVKEQTNFPAGLTQTINTTYWGNGQIQSKSNPYLSTSDPSYGITSYLYDALGRMTQQCQPDNSSMPATICTAGASYQSWSYSGATTSFKNEDGASWVRTTDGLGRLAAVTEPGGLLTAYSYSPLGDLLSSKQTGVSGEAARTRSFTYDSLSRLLSANNPETGLICYGVSSSAGCTSSVNGYDANGNLSARTDARGVTTVFQYDNLNRLLSRTSSGYPSNCYQYDGSESNGLGRLVNEWTQSGTCSISVPASGVLTLRSISGYDPMGRITGEQQCNPNSCVVNSGPELSYSYDLDGNETGLINSVGISGNSLALTAVFDSSGHMQSVTSSWPTSPTALYTLAPTNGYGAIGPLSWTLGTGLSVTEAYTNRLRVQHITATSTIP